MILAHVPSMLFCAAWKNRVSGAGLLSSGGFTGVGVLGAGIGVGVGRGVGAGIGFGAGVGFG